LEGDAETRKKLGEKKKRQKEEGESTTRGSQPRISPRGRKGRSSGINLLLEVIRRNKEALGGGMPKTCGGGNRDKCE